MHIEHPSEATKRKEKKTRNNRILSNNNINMKYKKGAKAKTVTRFNKNYYYW